MLSDQFRRLSGKLALLGLPQPIKSRVTSGLSCTLGKTRLGHVVTTGAALLHGLPADPQPSALMLLRITFLLSVVSGNMV
jgi:hypothetical protein